MSENMELLNGGMESDLGASAEAAQSESQSEDQRQPNFDLDNDPRFREWKSTMDRRTSELERRAREAERAAREAQMAGMDDYERVSFERDEYHNQLMSLQQQIEQERQVREAIQNRDSTLRAISKETGVPVDAIDGSSPEAAWQSAVRYLRDKQQGVTPEKASRVDVGGGAPQSTAEARQRAQLNNLRKQKAPAVEMYKLLLGGD